MSHYKLPPMIAVLWLAAASANAWGEDDAAWAQPSAEQVAPQPSAQPHADPVDQWLDEVKAQRRAWEERRRSAKEAVNARRRLADPWGAAHQEAQEKETQRRHDALLEQVERDRETFRNQGPWQGPGRWEQGPPPPTVRQPGVTGDPHQIRSTPEPAAPDGSTQPPAYPPSGWDNRWYFRGY